MLFVADGRFHLESVMMQNIALSEAGKFLRYDPYTGRMTKEAFRHDWLRDARREQLKLAKAAQAYVCPNPTYLAVQSPLGKL